MEARDALKFVGIVMTMVTGVAYSFGVLEVPQNRSKQTQSSALRQQAKDKRTDGGTANFTQTASTLDLISNSE